MYIPQPNFANGEIYHIYNRGIDRRPIFTNKQEYRRLIQSLAFYIPTDTSIRLSHYLVMSQGDQQKVDLRRQMASRRVSTLSYCLMPNHFHLLLRQESEGGISEYLRLLQNSYARYFNIKHSRSGALFEGIFKAVYIESQQQLVHVSRYIHLNPYTAYLVKDPSNLANYAWSSLRDYVAPSPTSFIDTQTILSDFSSTSAYYDFVLDQADYQRSLVKYGHLILEDEVKS